MTLASEAKQSDVLDDSGALLLPTISRQARPKGPPEEWYCLRPYHRDEAMEVCVALIERGPMEATFLAHIGRDSRRALH